jgi:hypothetical protein
MPRVFVTTVLALVIASVVVVVLPANVLYPDECSAYPTANGVPTQPGQFCIRYDPALRRYEVPPAGVPADISRLATVTARPDDVRRVAGTIAFGAAFVVIWSLVALALRVSQSWRSRRPGDKLLSRQAPTDEI